MPRDAGPDGMMCWQVEIEIGRTHQAVSGNMTHLAEDGRIVKTSRKGKTPRGFSAYYWVHNAYALEPAVDTPARLGLF